MSQPKTYRLFIPEEQVEKFKGQEGTLFAETLIDEDTQEAFRAKIIVSQLPQEGCDRLLLQARSGFLPGPWFVKIVEQEEDEEEAVKVFESMRLGERRGYMLRSMMAEGEEKSKRKEAIMTTELEKRLQKKRDLVETLLSKKNNNS